MESTEPVRVLFLNSRSEYGGADMGLLSIVRSLDHARFQAIIALPADGPLVPALQATGAEVLWLDICRLERLSNPLDVLAFGRRFVSSLFTLRRVIRAQRIDLVYTNSSAIQVGALAARWAGVPNIWHIREIWASPRWLAFLLYRYVYCMADRIIAVTKNAAVGNFGHDSGKISVVRDGIDLTRFDDLERRAAQVRRLFDLPQPWPIVVNVARIVPQKGLTCFVEAARRVRDAGLDAYFCVAGDIPRPMYQDYKDSLVELIARYDLSDRVRLLGWVEDVPALLRASDLLVLSSIGTEGGGLVMPEAWLAGIPVVVPDHTGPKEIVQDGRNGLLFRTGDADDLGEKIDALLREPDVRRRLAEVGRQDALALHDADRNTRAIEALMLDLVRTSHG